MSRSLLQPINAWSLRTQMACGAAILAVTATLVLSTVIGSVTLERLRADAGVATLATALQMGETLSRGMSERFRDIHVVANLDTMSNPTVALPEKRRLLDEMQKTFPDYAWIGLTDVDGRVLASAGGILEGADVSQRPWYLDGRWGPIVKDVHEAVLLAKLLPANADGEPLRFVDIAVPLRDHQGARVGVLGAHLSWGWAGEVRDALLQTRSGGPALEILVLSRDGTVLLGPGDLVGEQLALPGISAALDGTPGHSIETWPDGQRYLTATAQSTGYGAYPGLGWVVAVRQPVEIAFASADTVQAYIIVGGGLTSLALAVGGWLAARRITRPVLAIAEVADRIAQDDPAMVGDALGDGGTRIAAVRGSREVGVLGRSLRHLLDQVQHRETDLIALNQSLEQRVDERTRSLQSANEELQREIELRSALEAEREQLITELRSQAETDSLTGLYNRRAFMDLAQRELRRAQRQQGIAAVIMLDLDHFKRINDGHGHPAGDAVLNQVAEILRLNLRAIDIIGRLGGEEFAVMLVDCDPAQVVDLAERLRQAIAARAVMFDEGTLQVTASFGVALATGDDLRATRLDTLLAKSDKALYRAKAEGRNRVLTDDTVAAVI